MKKPKAVRRILTGPITQSQNNGNTIIALRNLNTQFIAQLDILLMQFDDELLSLQDEIRELQCRWILSLKIWNRACRTAYRELYKCHKEHQEDKPFAEKHHSELAVYKVAVSIIMEYYSGLQNSKKLLQRLDNLAQKRNALMSLYEDNKAPDLTSAEV